MQLCTRQRCLLWILQVAALCSCSASKSGGGEIYQGPPDASEDSPGVLDAIFGDGQLPEAATCAVQTERAERVPFGLYIMMDQSGSMAGATSGGQFKWQAIASALESFFKDKKSADLEVGIQYFPQLGQTLKECSSNDQCKTGDGCVDYGNHLLLCTRLCSTASECGTERECGPSNDPTVKICLDSCKSADYETPEVEIAPLSEASQLLNLTLSLKLHGPLTYTPTYPALKGALDHASAWQQAHPDTKMAVLLGTDGMPTECFPAGTQNLQQGLQAIASLSSAAYGLPSPIRTYVVGVFGPEDADAGSPQSNLDMIAKAGGTESALIVQTGADLTAQFLAALNAIRKTALPCEFHVPTKGIEGGQVNFSLVNVQFVPSEGAAVPLYYVEELSACDPQSGGWYYDRKLTEGTPSQLILCPASCEQARQDEQGEIDIEMGCETRTKPPA